MEFSILKLCTKGCAYTLEVCKYEEDGNELILNTSE